MGGSKRRPSARSARPAAMHAKNLVSIPTAPVAALLLIVAACVVPLLGSGCERAPKAPKILIVGIDGADWRMVRPLIAAGELPHLQRLMDGGISGPLWSLKPIISPVIWTTIATGKGPDKHGVLDFTMPDPNTGKTIVVTSQIRRSKAFWNILSEQGLRVCVVGWWASWPAEPVNGVIVSDRLSYHAFIQTPEAEEGLVYPPEKLSEILALRHDARDVSYDVARQFMNVTQAEYAAAPALDFYDPISHFRHIYQTMTSYTAITKHLIRKEHPDVVAVYFEGVDTAGHMYMRYTPPPYPHTTEAERQKYGHTVEAFYKYQDRLLGELLELTDENTTVLIISDHGFLLGRERPIEGKDRFDYATAALWHRIEGVIIADGPQVRSVGTVPGAAGAPGAFTRATVFDITPTLLALLGLPASTDMDGRVLNEMLVEDFRVPTRIATYEDEAWRENRAEQKSLTQGVDEEMKERLRSLGYIGAEASEEVLSLWGQWSLAEYYLFRNETEKARNELMRLRERAPDWPDSYFLLGVIHTQRKEYEQARAMYEKVLELTPTELEARLNLAFVCRQLGLRERGIAVLEESTADNPYRADIRVNLGILHKELGHLDRSKQYFEEVLQLDPDSHPAHAQLALICEQQDDYTAAAEHWAAAVRLNPGDRTARARLADLQEKGYAAPTRGR